MTINPNNKDIIYILKSYQRIPWLKKFSFNLIHKYTTVWRCKLGLMAVPEHWCLTLQLNSKQLFFKTNSDILIRSSVQTFFVYIIIKCSFYSPQPNIMRDTEIATYHICCDNHSILKNLFDVFKFLNDVTRIFDIKSILLHNRFKHMI